MGPLFIRALAAPKQDSDCTCTVRSTARLRTHLRFPDSGESCLVCGNLALLLHPPRRRRKHRASGLSPWYPPRGCSQCSRGPRGPSSLLKCPYSGKLPRPRRPAENRGTQCKQTWGVEEARGGVGAKQSEERAGWGEGGRAVRHWLIQCNPVIRAAKLIRTPPPLPLSLFPYL